MAQSFVIYYRVSTAQQGASGLGLEAQAASVARYLAGQADHVVVGEFREIESGRASANRPRLLEALSLCADTGATLVIANLSRLARNVRFISSLIEEQVSFVACDMPNANKVMLQMYSVMSEWERDAISERTKAALQQARKRGVVLGGDRGYRAPEAQQATWRAAGCEQNAAKADRRVARWRADFEPLAKLSLRGAADALNRAGRFTESGAAWRAATVARMRARLAA